MDCLLRWEDGLIQRVNAPYQIISDENDTCKSRVVLHASVVRYLDKHKNPIDTCQNDIKQYDDSGKESKLMRCAKELRVLIAHRESTASR